MICCNNVLPRRDRAALRTPLNRRAPSPPRRPGSRREVNAPGRCDYRNSGTMGLIDATPDGYHLVSQFEQPDRDKKYKAWPHPVIADGRLYLRDQDLLLCYDIRQK